MDTTGQVGYRQGMAWREEPGVETPARTSDGMHFALALPLGRTEATRRYLEDRRRSGHSLPQEPCDGDGLGVASYLEMLYDFGLMEPRGAETHERLRPAGMLAMWSIDEDKACSA